MTEVKEFQVGDIVGNKYLLVREVARGGGGIVFEAEHKFTTRRVAIKVLDPTQQGQMAAECRLLREARALSVARHPNVVEVLDAGKCEPGGPYLVMELLEGRPVDGLLVSRGKLSPVEAAWLCVQVAQGAAKLHRHGLVHRDIKPSNVFIKYDQQGEELVTLLDFGAVTHEALQSAQRITRENALIGTPEYMSPEQLTGATQPDPRMDIYSIGVMLYECLLGGVPHQGSYGEILLSVHTQRPGLLQAEEEQLSAPLRSILAKAMALEPEARYQSANLLAADLQRLLPADAGDSVSLLGIRGESEAGSGLTSGRRHTRAPYVTPIALIHADGSIREGKTQDVSTGGILVLAPGECDPTSIVGVRMALPSGGQEFETTVVGRWGKSGRQGTVLGLEFDALPDDCAEDVRTYVAQMLARKALEILPESTTIPAPSNRIAASETRIACLKDQKGRKVG